MTTPSSDTPLAELLDEFQIASAEWAVAGVVGKERSVKRTLAAKSAIESAFSKLRETNQRLNRRVQSAEAGLAEKINENAGRSFGRALANASATMHAEQLKEAKATVAALSLENQRLRGDIEKGYSDIYKTQLRYRESAREATERYGFKEGELQWLWRSPDCLKRRYDVGEVIAAICDALTREGHTAWPGDGTSCVEQMIRLQWERAEKAEAELAKLRLISSPTEEPK